MKRWFRAWLEGFMLQSDHDAKVRILNDVIERVSKELSETHRIKDDQEAELKDLRQKVEVMSRETAPQDRPTAQAMRFPRMKRLAEASFREQWRAKGGTEVPSIEPKGIRLT